MGPIILLDKSTLESLSMEEISFLSSHYYLVITPTLIFEIMGDLSKPPQKRILSRDKVRQLSQKILFTDSFMNINYQTLCLGNLLGCNVPMIGKPIVEPGIPLKTSTGQKIIFYEEHSVRKVLRDWANGNFTEAEKNISQRWREALKKLNLEPFQKEVDRSFEKMPKMKILSELNAFLDKEMSNPDPSVQWENIANVIHAFIESWDFMLNLQGVVLENIKTQIYNRWHKKQLPTLSVFAPYAHYLLKVSYLFSLGLRSGLLTPKRSNAFDIEYLYYLPFCMAFSSGDNFHVNVAPQLLRKDQHFVHRDDLKKDLRWLKEDWDSLTDEEKKQRNSEYGPYPPENQTSITYQLWMKNLRPRRPASGHRPKTMTKEENDRIIQEMQPVFQAIDEYKKLKRWVQQT